MFDDVKKLNLREAFLEEMQALAGEGKNVVTLDCEVGTATYTTQFGRSFPERHYEMGVAEQNMFGVAAGMSSAGVIPFAATFAVFTSMRACEMVRTSICYPRRNVKMIGGYAGLTDGKDGATHHSIEDLAIMRAIPNNVVLVCSDPVMTKKIIRASAEYDGPVYIRMEYEKVPCVHSEATEFKIGKGVMLREGKDVTITTIGPAIARAVEAAEELGKQGIEAEVIDILSLKPFDSQLVIESVKKTGALITVEDHNIIGGLASAVCEALVNANINIRYRALAIKDTFTESGDTSQLRKRYGIDSGSIKNAAFKLCKEGK